MGIYQLLRKFIMYQQPVYTGFRSVFIVCSVKLFFILASFQVERKTDARQIIDNMYLSIDKIKSLKFTMRKIERVNDQYLKGEQQVRFSKNPKSIYTKVISPNEGVEVLYVEGKNKNAALINPNTFPYINLSLDPYGSIMRNNNHHTVHEVGFDYISDIISHIDEKSGSDFNNYFTYVGDTLFDGKPCYKIKIDYKPFAYTDYEIQAGENITSIAYKLHISDYMILQLNKNLSGYQDGKPGMVIRVPNAYSKQTFLYIDKKTFLPLLQIMYDDKGLYEQYAFYNLQLNPVFGPDEFNRKNEEYDF